tara:strand:+ start:42 stop:584 length:543 start_codon:yes stop_codon:yes gene_type:complete
MFLLAVIFGGLIIGFFCSNVAEEKGYSGVGWFIAGFLFNFAALIAVAGLPDRKLRRYLRLIGEKQNAIKIEKQNSVLSVGKKDKLKKYSSNKKIVFEDFKFRTPIDASEELVYEELVKVLTATEEGKKAFNSIQVDSYEFNKPLLGGVEFVVDYAEGQYSLILSSKKDKSEMIWEYSDSL